jgi:5-methyltetrahydrofolate--homocysteine methyltransferase
MLLKLTDAIIEMREAEAMAITDELIENGTSSIAVLEACRKAMEAVGRRYEQRVYFLPELMLAGEMLTRISEAVKPGLASAPSRNRRGKVLIGTVAGDLHDIGKNIVAFMLEVGGFEVMDLGIDVPPKKFIEAVRSFQPQVVGLSGFLTLAFDAMKELIAAIEQEGLRDKVKIMIGGGQIDDQVRKHTGADAYGKDAMTAVKLALTWTGGN